MNNTRMTTTDGQFKLVKSYEDNKVTSGAVVTVQGNTCPRGDAYARREVTAPTRIVTTTVRVTGGTLPAVSCKTRSDIPKEKIFDVVRALKSVVVPAPVHIGQVLLPDAAGTCVDVVATKDVAEV